MYNTNVLGKLNKLEKTQVWAKMTGSGTTWDFLINPESIEWSHAGEYSKLPVLNTQQPLVRYKYSESVVTFPKVLFLTRDSNRDLDPLLKVLVALVRPGKSQEEPEILKVEMGDLIIDRCYLKQVQLSEQQWRSGKCTAASGSLEFILAPETPKAVFASATDQTILTPREQKDNLNKLKDALTSDKKLLTSLGITNTENLSLNNLGQVSVGGIAGGQVSVGNITDLLGKTLRPGLNNL